jgi:transcriptional antiterminator NusG
MGDKISQQDDDWSVDQGIEILNGPWAGFKGKIYKIDHENKRVIVKVNFWGRDIDVELNFHQIKPLE